MRPLLKTFFLFSISFLSLNTSASHYMGGNITYNCVAANTFGFTVTLYRDCNGTAMPGFLDMNLTSGSCGLTIPFRLELVTSVGSSPNPEIVTPLCPSEPDACQGPSGIYGIEKYVYAYVPAGPYGSSPPVTLPQACTDWIVSTPPLSSRSNAITTGPSGNIYLETLINNTNNICNSSPFFGFEPVLYACVGDTVVYNHGVNELNKDSLVFSLTDCLNGSGNSVNYNAGLSGINPLVNNYINVDSQTGTITFFPTLAQTAAICVKVEEYRNGMKISEITRDMQISILNCSNTAPKLSGINGTNSNTINICANQQSSFTINAFNTDVSQVISIINDNFLSGATYTITGSGNQKQLTVTWTPTVTNIGTNRLNISVSDDNCPVLGIGNYCYLINVVDGGSSGSPFSQATINVGDSIQLPIGLSNSNCTITWTPSTSLSCTNCATPTATPTTTTTYYYQINCPGTCGSLSDSITINTVVVRTISGTISRSDGLPLSNSNIFLTRSGSIVETAILDSNGDYSITTSEDSFYITASPGSIHFDQQATFYSGTAIFANANLFTFNGNSSVSVNFATLPFLKTISGNITQSNGNALENSKILLFDQFGFALDSTVTDMIGDYSLTTFRDSVYIQAIPNSSYTNQYATYYNGAANILSATRINFTSLTENITFSTIGNPHILDGTISKSDGSILDNSWIYLLDNNENVIDSILTNASGNYQFTTTIDSVYLMVVPNVNDQLTTYYNSSEIFANATLVTFTNFQATVNFSTLPKPTVIEGIIIRSDGLPLGNSWIHLMDNNLVNIDSIQTTIQGDYSFEIANTSIDYYLKATPSMSNNDQVVTYYNNVETIQDADSIPINTIINTINFSTIDTANATGGKGINGVLYLGVENDPVPLSGIRLILKNANGDFINDVTTNGLGEFSFYGLDNSIYNIWVDKIGVNNMIAPVALASDVSTDTLYFELFDNRLEALVNNTNLVINESKISIYPNPVTTELMIEYDLEKAAKVYISIVDLQGKQAKTLQNENQNSGNYQLIEKINKNLLPNGIYFIRLQFDNQIVTKQIIIQTK